MDSLAFLEATGQKEPRPVYVLTGDEDFLKRQVLAVLRNRVLGDDNDGMALSSYEGDKAVLANVLDELRTLPFLSPRRLVVIDNADPFVTKHRAALEKYVAGPATKGVLVLNVKTWTSTTRLAKQLGRREHHRLQGAYRARLAGMVYPLGGDRSWQTAGRGGGEAPGRPRG